MFVSVLGVIVERHILSGFIKLEIGGGCQALNQGGLTVKLMRELLRVEHGLRVDAGRLRKARIQRQRRRTCLSARLGRELEQLLLGLDLIGVESNVGGYGG